MGEVMRQVLLGLCAMLLIGCGSLGRLDADAMQRREIARYDRVVVGEFAANDTRRTRGPAHAQRRAAQVEAGRIAFAQQIAQALRETDAFDEVLEGEGEGAGRALEIVGSIDVWEPGNLAVRLVLGFAGKSRFDATVQMRDRETGTVLGRLRVDRNSWPLPIGTFTNVAQSVEFHMRLAAERVAQELARAKSVETPDAAGGQEADALER
jgi:hypothetical protein